MMDLSWLIGKTISKAIVQRAGQNLEMVFGVYANINELVIELRNPDDKDWFGTEYMLIEDMVGRTVSRVDTRVEEISATETDYTYVIAFTDGMVIEIFADVQTWSDRYGRIVQIRDQLWFSVRNPNEESWEGSEVLDELDADLERTRQLHETAGEGELLPQYRYLYNNHF